MPTFMFTFPLSGKTVARPPTPLRPPRPPGPGTGAGPGARQRTLPPRLASTEASRGLRLLLSRLSCDIHTHTPARKISTNFQLYCTCLLYAVVIQTVLGMGMGMNVVAQRCHAFLGPKQDLREGARLQMPGVEVLCCVSASLIYDRCAIIATCIMSNINRSREFQIPISVQSLIEHLLSKKPSSNAPLFVQKL